MSAKKIFIAKPGGSLSGQIRVPGDKSVSHRAVMLGSLAQGKTQVDGFLQGEDSLNTLRAFRAMGVTISDPDAGKVVIDGVGLHGLQEPDGPMYMGNSGTSIRLLSGLLAAQPFSTELQGDESLSKRPMGRVIDPLTQMGAKIGSNEGKPPLIISGGRKLQGIDYVLPMASAQVKSCILLAGLYAEGETRVTEPAATRDHTERMLQAMGYAVTHENSTISLVGGGELTASDISVPADISSAAFFMVAASIAEDADIVLQQVGMNPTRIGVIEILRLMGADLQLQNERLMAGEPVADIRVRSAQLQGIQIPESLVPLAIDEFPVLFIAAANAKGETVLTGAEELRVKESDRIQVMADGMNTLGIKAQPTADGIVIQGGSYGGGEVYSHHDHRIAMAFAIAALCAKDEIVIHGSEAVDTSFPGFVELATGAGMLLQDQTA